MHGSVHLLGIPSQYPLRELGGFLDADTAVTERPHILFKQLVIRRVVQIDVEIVWEQEFHETKLILLTRFLADACLSTFLVKLVVVGGEIPSIRVHLRENFLRCNVRRDVPVRSKHDRFHHI